MTQKIKLQTKSGIRTYYVSDNYPLIPTDIPGVYKKRARTRARKRNTRRQTERVAKKERELLEREKKLREYDAAVRKREMALARAREFEAKQDRHFGIQDQEIKPVTSLVESEFARYFTWFRASGGFDTAGFWKRGETPPGLDEVDDEEFQGGYPRQWDSTTIGVTYDPLTRKNVKLTGISVKYKGIRPLKGLLEKLNRALQYGSPKDPTFDFRRVYPHWKFNYEVLEYIGTTLVGRYGVRDSKGRSK